MKVMCDCGAISEFIDSENGSRYTSGEGWYKVLRGKIGIHGEHDRVFISCENCKNEIWIFT